MRYEMYENRMKYENRMQTGMKLGKQDEIKDPDLTKLLLFGGKKK